MRQERACCKGGLVRQGYVIRGVSFPRYEKRFELSVGGVREEERARARRNFDFSGFNF